MIHLRNIYIFLLLTLSFGTVTDIDGNVYETIQIGEQLWTAENLKTTHYKDGSEILFGLSIEDWTLEVGSYTVYPSDYDDNAISTCGNDCSEIYGNLYNWYAAIDERGICPEGWHVPSSDEYNDLINYIGGNYMIVGGKMKSTGTIEGGDGLWNDPNEGATNESGFTGIPGGSRTSGDGGIYEWIGKSGRFWSSSPYSSLTHAYGRRLQHGSIATAEIVYSKGYGFSIRCLHDEIIDTGCTDPEACNYDESSIADDGSCQYEFDCAGTCGGELELDCCGVCGGDNSQCSNCCGSPFYEDCTDDCSIDLNGTCCYEIEVDACGECNGNGTDCNNNGIPDDCEETYTFGYNVGYIDGLITGQIGSDENNDGLVDDFPLITILGNTALVLTQNLEATYTDDGASCFAGETNISQNIEVSGDIVNLSNIGTYVLSYNCQDNVLGNQAITKYRTVIVQADYSDEDNDGYDDASYIAGLEEGILLGGQSGDANGDGILNILDIVYFVDVILNP